VDLGSGAGGVGLALARGPGRAVLLVEPDAKALRQAADRAGQEGLAGRVAAVLGRAEALPLRSETAALVVSRGSIFFWDDPIAGLREVYRVLRVGGKAMVGGGLGTAYPEWARREFARRRLEAERRRGAASYAEFQRLRDPSTFRAWAHRAGLGRFQVMGDESRSAEASFAGAGIWLRFTKEAADDR
jgi:SAM-dependent methyltransferase